MEKFSIKMRVSLGMLVLVVLLVTVTAFSFNTVRTLGETYKEYRATAKQTIAINNFVEDLFEARIASFKYRLDASGANAADVRSNIEEITRDAANLTVFAGNPDGQAIIQQIASGSTEYLAGFDRYASVSGIQRDTKSAVIESSTLIRAASGSLEDYALAQGDTRLAILSSGLYESILLARLSIQDLILFEAPEFVASVEEQLDAARRLLAEIDQHVVNAASADQGGVVQSSLETMQEQFQALEAQMATLQDTVPELVTIRTQTLDRIGPLMQDQLEAATEDIVTRQDRLGPQGQAIVEQASWATPAFGLLAIILSLGTAFVVGRWIAKPVDGLADTTEALARGKTDVTITGAEHQTELGRMARSLEIFREAHLSREALAKEQEVAKVAQQNVVDALSVALDGLAQGKLRTRVESVFPAEYEKLRQNFNAAMTNLETAIGSVTAASRQIDSAADEIKSSSSDLSNRTENQAATLEETAAALDTLTSSVKSSAEKAKEVETTVGLTHRQAKESGKVVEDAVAAMRKIEASSTEISNITDLIADIAFQTNLLALNAGVEAARAGDHGRGFAVVASEVRALAQRSSEAAKQVSDLISNSAREVVDGTTLVVGAGDALSDIIARVEDITDLVASIAAIAAEQANGISEINVGVSELDRVTQQNASMVEQSNMQSAGLADQAKKLSQLVQQFELAVTDTFDDNMLTDPVERALAS